MFQDYRNWLYSCIPLGEVNEKQKTAGRKDVKNLQEVINGIYIDKKRRSDICKSLFISGNTLNRYRKKGIDEITMIFRTCRLVI